MTTSLPVVDSDQNGPGTADVYTDVYINMAAWSGARMPMATSAYTGYDPLTGAVIQTIQDVNTSSLSDLQNDVVSLPGGGARPMVAPASPPAVLIW